MSNEQKLREHLQEVIAYARESGHDWMCLLGAEQALAMPTAAQPRIRIPTDAMEQAFQSYYRRGFEAGYRAAMTSGNEAKPAFKIYKGEVCYKSEEDDQSYGMWCPVSWIYKPPFPEGTEFVPAMKKAQS